MFVNKVALVALFAVGTLGLSACSEEPGVAEPSPTAPGDTTATSVPAEAPTTQLDACSLLSSAELKEIGNFKDGEVLDTGGARGCSWNMSESIKFKYRFSIDVAVRDRQGIKDANDAGGGIQKGKMGSGRKAVLIPTTRLGGCILALAVGETSRVDIAANGVEDSKKACDIASQVADIVDPKLPKG